MPSSFRRYFFEERTHAKRGTPSSSSSSASRRRISQGREVETPVDSGVPSTTEESRETEESRDTEESVPYTDPSQSSRNEKDTTADDDEEDIPVPLQRGVEFDSCDHQEEDCDETPILPPPRGVPGVRRRISKKSRPPQRGDTTRHVPDDDVERVPYPNEPTPPPQDPAPANEEEERVPQMEAEPDDVQKDEDKLSYHDLLPDDMDNAAGYQEPEDADVPFAEESRTESTIRCLSSTRKSSPPSAEHTQTLVIQDAQHLCVSFALAVLRKRS